MVQNNLNNILDFVICYHCVHERTKSWVILQGAPRRYWSNRRYSIIKRRLDMTKNFSENYSQLGHAP
jgi:hypothetical protein